MILYHNMYMYHNWLIRFYMLFTLFYSFLKNYSTSVSNILREAFSNLLNVELWTLFFFFTKYIDPRGNYPVY